MATPPEASAAQASPLPPPAAPWAPQGRPLLLANWTQRALAYGVDLLVVAGIFLVAGPLLLILAGDDLVLTIGLIVVMLFVYFFAFGLAGGRSLGKRMLRLRTASLDGSPPSVAQSLVDAVSKVAVPFVLDLPLGLLVAPGRKQRLVQRAVGLVVVFEPPAPPRRVVFVP